MYTIDSLKSEEQRFIFDTFQKMDYWQLGQCFVQAIQKRSLPVATAIHINDKLVFYYGSEQSTKDQFLWIERKRKACHHFQMSTLMLKLVLESKDKTLAKNYYLDESEYSPFGGSFPIRTKGAGVIGTITLSGLSQMEDHQLIIEVLEHFFEK